MVTCFSPVTFRGFDVDAGRWVYVLEFNMNGLLYDHIAPSE